MEQKPRYATTWGDKPRFKISPVEKGGVIEPTLFLLRDELLRGFFHRE